MVFEILKNTPLLAALLASVIAQVLKVFIELFTDGKVSPARLTDTGGMPSAHTAGVTALATCIGLQQGFASSSFAICAVFGYLTMYDAAGIRRAAGIQAELINELVQELSHIFDDGFKPDSLKTLLGHTYPQVFVGALLGISTGIIMYYQYQYP